MLEFLMDNWGALLIPGVVVIVMVISIIRIIINSKSNKMAPDLFGLLGKIFGASVFRGLPNSITGAPPTGHYQKPNFSYDEEKEKDLP